MIKFNFFSMQCLLHSTDVFKGESIRKMICPIYVSLLLYHFLTDYMIQYGYSISKKYMKRMLLHYKRPQGGVVCCSEALL